MDQKESPVPTSDLREYLAAERTVLAYVRTGLSMMGIGFVVARFGLFLRLMQLNANQAPQASTGRSLLIGTSLVVLGSAVTVLSAWQYWRQVQQLNQKMNQEQAASWLAVSLAIILSMVGLAMAAYVVSTSPS